MTNTESNEQVKAGHTPGKWHAATLRTQGIAPGCDIGSDNNSNIAIVHHQPDDRSAAETIANARLIAASPMLLEACRTARSAIVLGNGREIDWDIIADELSVAIRAAEGETE